MNPTPTDTDLCRSLHLAIEQLADAIDDEPPIAAALRRFARALPITAEFPTTYGESTRRRAIPPRRPLHERRPLAFRALLYRALDAGTLDAQRFDWLMLAERRAARVRRRQAHRRTAES